MSRHVPASRIFCFLASARYLAWISGLSIGSLSLAGFLPRLTSTPSNPRFAASARASIWPALRRFQSVTPMRNVLPAAIMGPATAVAAPVIRNSLRSIIRAHSILDSLGNLRKRDFDVPDFHPFPRVGNVDVAVG